MKSIHSKKFGKTRKNKKISKTRKTRKTRKFINKKRNKIGGAAQEEIFDNVKQLNDYINKNINWIDMIYIYKKTNFPGPSIKSMNVNHNISLFNNNKGFIYELDNINNYIFQFV